MATKATSAALLAISLIGLTKPAGADQNLNCDAYATKAVQQQQTNQSMSCSLSGGAWSTDYSGHRNWCLQPSVKMADLTREDAIRAEALRVCGQRGEICDQYASLAREQYLLSVALGCDFSGPRWSDDVTGHRSWCMSRITDMRIRVVGPGHPIFETGQRDSALKECRSRGDLAQSSFQNANQKAQEYMNMLGRVMKMLNDAHSATVRSMQ